MWDVVIEYAVDVIGIVVIAGVAYNFGGLRNEVNKTGETVAKMFKLLTQQDNRIQKVEDNKLDKEDFNNFLVKDYHKFKLEVNELMTKHNSIHKE